MFILFIGPIVGVAVAIIATVVLVSAVSGVIANLLNDNDENN